MQEGRDRKLPARPLSTQKEKRMKKFQRIAVVAMLAASLWGMTAIGFTPAALASPQASGTSFHFVFSADSRGNYTVLPDFSHKMVTLNPVFGFFGGDLCSTLDTSCINNQWKPAMDGNNNDGMLAKTFVGRGNHDAGTLSTWQGLWDFAAMGTRVGATHYTAQTSDATYSFDYGNSHFAVVDNPTSGAAGWTSTQISWLDNDLTAAENRGAVHEFLIVHGPMYTVTSEHANDLPGSALKAVLNRHPRLIGFHGHEHITAYTRVTPTFEAGITDYPQFTLGRAGAPAYPVDKPVTWQADVNAFGDVAINDASVTVTVYSQGGSALYTKTFSHSSTTPPTPTPGGSTGATTVTYVSNATYDGHVLESTETSGQGGTLNSSGSAFRLGDDASNRQYRAVLSFNTADHQHGDIEDQAGGERRLQSLQHDGQHPGRYHHRRLQRQQLAADQRLPGNLQQELGDEHCEHSHERVVHQEHELELLRVRQQDRRDPDPPALRHRRQQQPRCRLSLVLRGRGRHNLEPPRARHYLQPPIGQEARQGPLGNERPFFVTCMPTGKSCGWRAAGARANCPIDF
jgi:hypothetical protein